MKIAIYILLAIALGLGIYNATFININNMLHGDSKTALIGLFSSGCVIILLCILLISKSIQKKVNAQR